MSRPPLAKSSGVTLEDHTDHVAEEARAVLQARPLMAKKYRELTGDDLEASLVRAAEYHDKGKLHRAWYNACWRDYEEYRQWRREQGMDPDALHPADFKRYEKERRGQAGRYLRETGIRHEFASLALARERGVELSFPERVAIAAHHRKLSFKHQNRWTGDEEGKYRVDWEAFIAASYQWRNPGLEQIARERYRTAAVRALLQLADARASRREAGEEVPTVEPFTYDFPWGTSYRGVQQVVQQHWDDPQMILRAPTGSGKTDAALLWARRQVEQGRADRLVIAMPTRFTSNALALNIENNVSDTGLYHSSAWFTRWHGRVGSGELDVGNARELHLLARLLLTPVTVCTVDHLCMALTGTREDHHAIFFGLANSCVVIDEADFYDRFVQANLVVLLDVLRALKVPVLIMSATVPQSSATLYGINEVREDTSCSGEVRCRLVNYGPVEDPVQFEDLLRRALTQPTIIYANTVARAVAYYRWFEKQDVHPVLYHSRFTEPDKARIEAKLLTMLGREAWNEGTAHGVAIMTQIGEMSINISAPFMISDLCPWDRLAQRLGRLDRFRNDGDPVRELYVVIPTKKGELYPAPYGLYSDQEHRWEPGEPLWATLRTLEEREYTAEDFVDRVNDLYSTIPEFTGHVKLNQKELRNLFHSNWLIVACAETDEEADRVQKWRSRDIEPQSLVLTERPDMDRFRSWNEYREFVLRYGVECPQYELKRALKHELIAADRVPIGSRTDDEVMQPIFWVQTGVYQGDSVGLWFGREIAEEHAPEATSARCF